MWLLRYRWGGEGGERTSVFMRPWLCQVLGQQLLGLSLVPLWLLAGSSCIPCSPEWSLGSGANPDFELSGQ